MKLVLFIVEMLIWIWLFQQTDATLAFGPLTPLVALGGATLLGKGNPIKGLGKFAKGAGEFLFGSDPGKKPREALTKFGMTGELGGQSTDQLLNQILGSQPNEQRTAASQRLARSGLTGSGIGEDILGNVDLQTADELRKIRMSLIQARLQALGIGAGTPPQPGLLQSVAAPIGAALLG